MAGARQVRSAGRPIYGRPQPIKRRGRRFSWPRLGFIPRRLVILIIVGLVILFALGRFFAIKTISVTAPSRQTAIAAEAKQAVDKHWWQGNLLTFRPGALSSALIAADPMIKSVTATRHWTHGLGLVVTLKDPSLGWSSGNQNYLLDHDGTVIGTLPAGSKLPTVLDDSNLPVTSGQKVTSSRFVTFTSQLDAGLPSLGIVPKQYDVKETTLDLYVTTNKGYGLIFDTSRPVADELADLKVVLASLGASKHVPASYIDLRVDGKAYYK